MKRKTVIISVLVVIFLVTAAFILSRQLNDGRRQDEAEVAEGTAATDESTPANETVGVEDKAAESQTEETGEQVRILYSEELKVINNSPEYDLRASVYKNSEKEAFLKFEYYYEGAGVEKLLGMEAVPELGSVVIQGDGQEVQGDKKVKTVYLNVKFSKAYFIIEAASTSGFPETTLYVLNLKDQNVKKLFSHKGKFTDMFFTKNGKYIGCSYFDSPASSIFQERSLLEIVDCEKDEWIVTGSRDAEGNRIGTGRDPQLVYDYAFLSWHSNNTARLKETAFSKKDSTDKIKGQEVLYDVVKNIFLNPDGSPVTEGNSKPKPEETAVIAESEAVKTFKTFYQYLGDGKQYDNAMALLDDEFKLQLEILKQFGVDELGKKDISAEGVALYAELLKAARLDSIVKEETTSAVSTIYYYQILSTGQGAEEKQPMIAQLKKVDNQWRLFSVKDGKINEKPFKMD